MWLLLSAEDVASTWILILYSVVPAASPDPRRTSESRGSIIIVTCPGERPYAVDQRGPSGEYCYERNDEWKVVSSCAVVVCGRRCLARPPLTCCAHSFHTTTTGVEVSRFLPFTKSSSLLSLESTGDGGRGEPERRERGRVGTWDERSEAEKLG